ncbi:MAG TPA: hypothetical protein VMB21_13470 [Candidatus Limnocylindria bacterium]|jgi:prepilin-type processing-associated H-X9-DG protein|nr:hypothetical protein [Candidatus Limnocylindria bacterium]
MHVPRPKPAPRARCAAFSLFELLVVLLVMIVVSIIISRGTPQSRFKSQLVRCKNNLLFIHPALVTYANEHQGRFPATNTATSEGPLSLLVPTDTVRTEIFLCPGADLKKLPAAQPFADRRIGYAYVNGLTNDAGPEQVVLSDAQINTLSKTNGQLIFSPDGKGPGNNHGAFGGNLLFADGHVEASPTNAEFAVRLPPGTKLLNPRP